ncbi:MAG TPA: hypothetical protein PKU97_25485, partial [Kofleriaceae bacterium]|nr:hypothetical protein [Kofleriaceae bacterium]
PAPPTPPPIAPLSIQEAAAVLYAGQVPAACAGLQAAAVAPAQVTRDVIECMLTERYRKDRKAQDLALAFYRTSGSVAGVGEPETMDGGYRGTIRLVPQLPTGAHRLHLARVLAASASFEELFAKLSAGAAAAPQFRWRNLVVRFVRSVAKRTPSAYAVDWTVTYNVRGSLLGSADGVRETLFHEIFHLNDFAHGDWSARTLTRDYDAILARCLPKLTRACLAPYAPGTTTVRGGTYYAFQQDNGTSVHEYAAELALRYYKEHRELLATGKLTAPPFKCGPPENARAWKALVTEFFAGIDRTPAC